MRCVLAINFNHDGSATLLREGRIAAYVNTERFSRIRRHPGIREEDLDGLLRQAGVPLHEVDEVLLCNLHSMDSPEIPRLHGSDLKHTWFAFRVAADSRSVTIRGVRLPCLVNPEHHRLHAAAAFFTSPYESATILSMDPTGWALFRGQGTSLEHLEHRADWFDAPRRYADIAIELFGTSLAGAGKVMGLAPYGRGASWSADALRDADALWTHARNDPLWVDAGGRSVNARLAHAVQSLLDEQLARLLTEAHDDSGNLCLGGGTALNSAANQSAFQRSPFESLHLHPACGDDGTSIGAALWWWHERLGHERRPFSNAELMYSTRHHDSAVAAAVASRRERVTAEPIADTARAAAQLLVGDEVIGWFQGASEIGPRALGNRSILADPRLRDMREHLNLRVKHREPFRPFAPSVLAEHAPEWLGLASSPFMLRVTSLRSAEVPAVVHVDGTTRPQTVERDDNPAFHALLGHFRALTGVPLVLNTSFNTNGQPIVETPLDAIDCMLEAELDAVVFPGLVVRNRAR